MGNFGQPPIHIPPYVAPVGSVFKVISRGVTTIYVKKEEGWVEDEEHGTEG